MKLLTSPIFLKMALLLFASGFAVVMGLTDVTDGRSRHRAANSSSLFVICVAGCDIPAGVGRTMSSVTLSETRWTVGGSTTTGSADASGVPAHPPSPKDFRPPSDPDGIGGTSDALVECILTLRLSPSPLRKGRGPG